MRCCKKRKGFSLVELLVTITVLLVIGGMVAGLMFRMSSASSDQRRRQALHSNEEQTRRALLNIVRDVRMSYDAEVSGTTLTLYARHNGEEFTITYTLAPCNFDDMLIDIDIPDDANRIYREAVGDDGGDWPNPFIPPVVENVEYTLLPDGSVENRSRIRINLDIPVPNFDGTFRTWEIESAASFRRMPQAPTPSPT